MSETTNLKLKKHDNPETNTEKFDIENYLNGNWDKIDKNVGEVNTDISNINSKNKEQDTNIEQLQENTETSSNKISELEKELKEAQEDFYQNSIRGQASGEYIHVEDSSNCRSIIGIGGNHEQETRSGKNYLNTLAKYKAGEKVTVDGITYIFNEDGSITCNGTATADSVLTFSSNLQTINGSGKKIVGMITGTQVPAKLSILAYTSDWSKNTFELLSSVNKNITINMQENIDYTIFRIIAYKGTTLNNQTIYYQILDTSVNDLTYEQYGASPSTGYPSKVVAVGSNVNIFDKEKYRNINNWSNSQGFFIYCKLDEEDTAKFKKIITGSISLKGKSQNLVFGISTTNNAGSFNNQYRMLDNETIKNITYDFSNAENIYLCIGNANKIGTDKNEINLIFDNYNIKFEEGTVATPWSPYGMGSVGIDVVNKNLLNIANTEKTTKGGITYSIKNGILKLNGTATASFDIQLSKNIKIKKGKYTHSSSYIQPGLYISFNNLGYTIISAQVGKKRTFEITEDTTYKSYFIWIDKGTVLNNVEIKLQLEAGTTVTDFIEHQSQSVIMPVQKEMLVNDYLDYDNEEEVHVWNKQILTGNEKVMCSLAPSEEASKKYKTVYLAVTLDTAGEEKLYKTGNVMSNMFKNLYNPSQIWGNDAEYAVEESIALQTKLRLRINKSRLIGYSDDLSLDAKAELFKAYLKAQYDAGTPVMIYYKQATPTRLKFTDEQKAVAKELNNARTYKNVTNITTDSKAILSLDYAKDIETLLTSKESEV